MEMRYNLEPHLEGNAKAYTIVSTVLADHQYLPIHYKVMFGEVISYPGLDKRLERIRQSFKNKGTGSYINLEFTRKRRYKTHSYKLELATEDFPNDISLIVIEGNSSVELLIEELKEFFAVNKK